MRGDLTRTSRSNDGPFPKVFIFNNFRCNHEPPKGADEARRLEVQTCLYLFSDICILTQCDLPSIHHTIIMQNQQDHRSSRPYLPVPGEYVPTGHVTFIPRSVGEIHPVTDREEGRICPATDLIPPLTFQENKTPDILSLRFSVRAVMSVRPEGDEPG